MRMFFNGYLLDCARLCDGSDVEIFLGQNVTSVSRNASEVIYCLRNNSSSEVFKSKILFELVNRKNFKEKLEVLEERNKEVKTKKDLSLA